MDPWGELNTIILLNEYSTKMIPSNFSLYLKISASPPHQRISLLLQMTIKTDTHDWTMGSLNLKAQGSLQKKGQKDCESQWQTKTSEK